MNELEEIFEAYAFVTPTGNDLEVLRQFVIQYPKFKRELLEFAKERAMINIETSLELTESEKKFVAEITRRNLQKFREQKKAKIQPIDSLTGTAKKLGLPKKEFANRIGISPKQLYYLETRSYIFSTIPKTLIAKIAQTLKTPRETIEAFLQLPQLTAANFKSQTRPENARQISFQEAICQDETLPTEEKENLLKME